jgi:hypothetical protein
MDFKLVEHLREDIFTPVSSAEVQARRDQVRKQAKKAFKIKEGDVVQMLRGNYSGMFAKCTQSWMSLGCPELRISDDNGLTFESNKFVGYVKPGDFEKVDYAAHVRDMAEQWQKKLAETNESITEDVFQPITPVEKDERSEEAYRRREELITDFQKTFPGAWVKDGSEFDGNISRVLWTGEGAYLDKEGYVPIFDPNEEADYIGREFGLTPSYEFGVHKKVIEWGEKNGIYFEPYDNGTLFGYWA